MRIFLFVKSHLLKESNILFISSFEIALGIFFELFKDSKISKLISLIIFSGIVAEIPRALASTFELGRTGALSALMIVGIFVLVILTVLFIVFFERAMRKILINYPKRQVGNKMYGGESSHLPLKINTAGVIPIIFAQSIILIPGTIATFFGQDATQSNFISLFAMDHWFSNTMFALLIIFFTYFCNFSYFSFSTVFSIRNNFIKIIKPIIKTKIKWDSIY